MATRNIAQLRTAALIDADLRAGQVATADVDSILNEELSELHELVGDAEQDRLTFSNSGLEIVAGADSTTVPTNLWKNPKLTDITDADPLNHRVLPTFEWSDRYHVSEKSWCIFGSTLHVRPTADAPGMYRMDGIYQWTDISGATTVDFPNDWHRWVSLKAALRLRSIQEMDTAFLQSKVDDVEARIMKASVKRKGRRKARDVRLVNEWRFRRVLPGEET